MKNLDTIIKNNLRSFESFILENKELFTEAESVTNFSQIPGIDCDKDGRRCYFKFSELGKIMFVPQYTTLYYFNKRPKTSEVLDVENLEKDEFGYYQEIFVPNYGERVKRYFPIEEWEDLNFFLRENIPFAIKTRDGDKYRVFTLILALVDPVSSVYDVRKEETDPPYTSSNPNRGWVISGGVAVTNQPTDSGTGYYSWDGIKYIPYNVTGPTDRYDPSTWVGDDTTELVKFWNESAGIVTQIAVSIVVTVLLRTPIAISLVGRAPLSIPMIQGRLMVATMLTEALVNVPVGISFFANPGSEYDTAGWISLMFCFLPLAQGTLLKNLIGDFSQKTAESLAQKILTQRLGEVVTKEQFETLYAKSTLDEKVLIARFFKKLPDALKNGGLDKQLADEIAKKLDDVYVKNKTNLLNNAKFLKAYQYLVDNVAMSPGFWTSIGVDFTSTYYFAKGMQKILAMYLEGKKVEGKTQLDLTQKGKDLLKNNVEKIQKEIEKLPPFFKLTLVKWNNDPKKLEQSLSIEDCQKMVNAGILTDEFKEALYNQSLDDFHEDWKPQNCEDFWDKNPDGSYKMKTKDGKQVRDFNEKIDVPQLMNLILAFQLHKDKIDLLRKENKKILDLYIKCLPEGGYFEQVAVFKGTWRPSSTNAQTPPPDNYQPIENIPKVVDGKWIKFDNDEQELKFRLENTNAINQNGTPIYEFGERTVNGIRVKYYKNITPKTTENKFDAIRNQNLKSTGLEPSSYWENTVKQ